MSGGARTASAAVAVGAVTAVGEDAHPALRAFATAAFASGGRRKDGAE